MNIVSESRRNVGWSMPSMADLGRSTDTMMSIDMSMENRQTPAAMSVIRRRINTKK